ncbi:MAG: hypothetical protein FWD55_02540 [Propionibacteriaceae bacterium]|nr:hypothetical protein [Propionibacteriaceae bacterium]
MNNSKSVDVDLGPALHVEYEGRSHVIRPGEVFDIGREADFSLDANPYLHRRFLRLIHEYDLWWLCNVGGTTAATVFDRQTNLQAWLGPSSRLPLVFGEVDVVFTAGPCTYHLQFQNEIPMWRDASPEYLTDTGATVADIDWTPAQRLAVTALAEPMLRREGFGMIHVPSNSEAADRIGWTVKRLEKKIDNICMKLDKMGVEGMRGGLRQHASGRRSRLVEWAVSSGFVTVDDLELLEHPGDIEDDG